MSRLVIIADLHVHPWGAFACGDGADNTRLVRTLEVMELSLRTAEQLGCPWVFAGDLVHTAGHSLNVVMGGIVRVLDRYRDVRKFVVWGNHDARSRGSGIWVEDTALAALESTSFQILRGNNLSLGAASASISGAGYQPGGIDLAEIAAADVGVYHQDVGTARLPSGIEVKEGGAALNVNRLWEKHRITIVGHVHQPQHWRSPDGNRVVLIPGSPEHHDFGDSGPRGFWVADLSGERVGIDFRDARSPEFRTVDDPSGIKDSHHYYRVRHVPVGTSLPEGAKVIAPSPEAIVQREVMKGVGPADVERVLEEWVKVTPPEEELGAIANLVALGRSLVETEELVQLAPLRLTRLELRNFGPYEKAELCVQDGVWLVTGSGRDYPSNGAGKTTLVGEALYWALFGRTTKAVAADEVLRRGTDTGGVIAELTGTTSALAGWRMIITRTRSDAGHVLHVSETGIGKTVSWEAPSVAAMTARLAARIGLTPATFRALGYFSQEQLLVFSAATDASRKDMLADLVGLSAYQAAAGRAGAQISEAEAARGAAETKLALYGQALEEASSRLEAARLRSAEWDRAHAVELGTLLSLDGEMRVRESDRMVRLDRKYASIVERIDRAPLRQVILLRRQQIAQEIADSQTAALTQRVEQDSKAVIAARAALEREWDEGMEAAVRCAAALIDRTRRAGLLGSAMTNVRSGHETATAAKMRTVHRREQAEAKVNALADKRASILAGVCPTCGQEIGADVIARELEALESAYASAQTDVDVARGAETVAVRALAEAAELVSMRERELEDIVVAKQESERAAQLVGVVQAAVQRLRDDEEHLRQVEELAVRESQVRTDAAVKAYEARLEQRRLRAARFCSVVAQRVADAQQAREAAIVRERERTNPNAASILDAEDAVATASQRVGVSERERQTAELQRARYAYWQKGLGRQGVQSLLLDEVAQRFNAARGEIIPALTQGVYDVQFSTTSNTQSGEARERTEFVVTEHGRRVPYDTLSGGQRRRVDLAVMLTLAVAVAEWTQAPGVLGVMVLDEVCSFLDASGAEGVAEALRAVTERIPTVYVVTHDQDLSALFPNEIRVEQDDQGVSRIIA